MKNYYDELEINKNASKEVIERVYKVLAKKYHPDITQETDKQAAEEKFKAISEAYEVLSDNEKRKKYDLELEQNNHNISYEEYINVVRERDYLNNSLNDLKNNLKHQNSYSNTHNNSHYQQATNSPPNNKHSFQSNINNSKKSNNSKKQKKSNRKKNIYYNTVTGKPVSAFTYYKYKIKHFFSTLFFLFLVVIAIILAINAFKSSYILNNIF